MPRRSTLRSRREDDADEGDEVDVGQPAATLAGDGLAMAMGPLEIEEDDGGGAAHGTIPKGGWLANTILVVAIIIFAANNSALLWVIKEMDSTTCNVLCAAQMVGIVSFGPIFFEDLAWVNVRALRWRDWAAIVGASLSRNVVGAFFDVEGMRMTSVPTLAIVEMLEPVEFLFLALCLLPHERRNRWIAGNMALLVVGVLAGLLLQPVLNGGPFPAAKGVAFLILGGFGYTLAEVIGHVYLEHVPLGIYAMARVVLGTAFYHLLAFLEGDGSDRYIEVRNLYSARLWKQMVWYGLVFVTIGQFVWLTALRRCRPQAISLGTSSLFLLNMLFSVLILGKPPTGAESVGGAIILVSITSSLLEARHHDRQEAAAAAAAAAGGKDGGQTDEETGAESGSRDGSGGNGGGTGREPEIEEGPETTAATAAAAAVAKARDRAHKFKRAQEGTISGSRA